MKATKVTALAVGCLATMILSNTTWAQITADIDKVVEQDLPTAEQIIADYVQATGGEENHLAIKSMVSNGELAIDIGGREVGGEVSIVQLAPNKVLIKTSIEGFGDQNQGFDGTVGWQLSDREGAQVLAGEPLQMLKLQADINQYMNLADHFSELKCTGEEEYNGEACYVVEASRGEDSKPLVAYFSKESKYLVGSKMSLELPQVVLQIENQISDYRDVGDVKMSFKTISKNQLYQQLITLEKIEINSELDESVFALPEEVQDLVDED